MFYLDYMTEVFHVYTVHYIKNIKVEKIKKNFFRQKPERLADLKRFRYTYNTVCTYMRTVYPAYFPYFIL